MMTAKKLSPFFSKVTIAERVRSINVFENFVKLMPLLKDDFNDKLRSGVGQYKHPHLLLRKGLNLMSEEFSDVKKV